jgi:CheY-like chemotaxis protein
LIIDDRPDDRLVLRRILEEAGFRVQTAETGESVVEVFQTWRPHFIWMDRRLPLMDGLEATRCIRSLDGGRDIKIAGVGASVFASEREVLLAVGMDDFVRKPYVPNDIFDCMARHIGVRYAYAKAARSADEEGSQRVMFDDLAALRPELRADQRIWGCWIVRSEPETVPLRTGWTAQWE